MKFDGDQTFRAKKQRDAEDASALIQLGSCDRRASRRAAASVPGCSSRVRPAAHGSGGTARLDARRSVLPGPIPLRGATPWLWRAGSPFGDPRKAIRYDGPSPPEVPCAEGRPAPWRSGRTGRRRAAGGNGCWWTRFDMYRTPSGASRAPGIPASLIAAYTTRACTSRYSPTTVVPPPLRVLCISNSCVSALRRRLAPAGSVALSVATVGP